MARDPSEASRALRRRARARVREARERGQRLFEAWKAIGDRQLAALDEIAGSALADEPGSDHDCATDLCSFWVGCWADAMDLAHEAWSLCLNPQGQLPVAGLDFQIERTAEAADPHLVPGVSVAQAGALSVTGPLTNGSSSIPVANVRVSTYRSMVLLSLVHLRGLGLVPGTYAGGELVLGGSQVIGPITVTVT